MITSSLVVKYTLQFNDKCDLSIAKKRMLIYLHLYHVHNCEVRKVKIIR